MGSAHSATSKPGNMATSKRDNSATGKPGKRTWLFRLVMLFCSLAVSLAIVEAMFRSQVPWSGRTPMRTSEIEGLPYQLRPGFATRYFGHDVQINKQGFRGPDVPAPEPGVLRVALIGDSITFGHVADDDTLSEQLARELKAQGQSAQVLNCGVSGYNAAHIAVLLEQQVLAFSPDVVVYVCCYNDGPEPGPVPRPEISPDQILDITKSFPLRSAFLEWGGRRAKALMRMFNVGSSKGYVAGILEIWNDGGSQRFATAVKRMQTLCADNGARLIVAFCPPMIHPQANPYGDIESDVEQICTAMQVDYLSLREAFDESEDLGKYQVGLFDSHPNAQANQRMACRMAQVLSTSKTSD